MWKADTQSPHSHPQQTEGVRLHGDSREIGEHQNRGLGMVEKKKNGCGGRGMERCWSLALDLGSDRIFRGEGTSGGAEILIVEGCQREMFGRVFFFGGGCRLEAVGSAWRRSSFL